MHTGVETGTRIRQICRMESDGPLLVVARGACTLAICAVRDNALELEYKVECPALLQHLATSPHCAEEMAMITTDGSIYEWDRQDQLVSHSMDVHERIICCEYSAHPRVLWTGSSKSLELLDLRDNQHRKLYQFGYDKVELVGIHRNPQYVR